MNDWATTFYTRSTLISNNKENGIKFDPPIDKWKQHCICRTPMNFDIDMMGCDKCNKWF